LYHQVKGSASTRCKGKEQPHQLPQKQLESECPKTREVPPVKKRGRPPKINQSQASHTKKENTLPSHENDNVSHNPDSTSEISSARMEVINNHVTALLECPGLASGIVHNLFHLRKFLFDVQLHFGEPPRMTWLNCINKKPMETYPI